MNETLWIAAGLFFGSLIIHLGAKALIKSPDLGAMGLLVTPLIAGGYMVGLLLFLQGWRG